MAFNWPPNVCRPHTGHHRVLLLRRPAQLPAQEKGMLRLFQAAGGGGRGGGRLLLPQRHSTEGHGSVSSFFFLFFFAALTVCVRACVRKGSALVFTIQNVRRRGVFGQQCAPVVWRRWAETRLLLSLHPHSDSLNGYMSMRPSAAGSLPFASSSEKRRLQHKGKEPWIERFHGFFFCFFFLRNIPPDNHPN